MREQNVSEDARVYIFFSLVDLRDVCLSLWTGRPSRRWLVDDDIAAVRCLQLIPATGRYSNESFSQMATGRKISCVNGRKNNEVIAQGDPIICLPGYVNV
jgi:hypothetical protein